MVPGSKYWVVAAVLILSVTSDAQEKLDRKELFARGKTTTAHVRVGNAKFGAAAVCINADGYFLTTTRVVPTDDRSAAIQVVLNPSTNDQKVLEAKILRVDKARNLVLLQTSGIRDIPCLSLGRPDELTERSELLAFGYPSNQLPGKNQFPAVVASVRTISSLDRKDEANVGARLSEPLLAGYEGGPLLASNGTLVGLATAGYDRPDTVVSRAVTMTAIREFLDGPEVRVVAPKFDHAGAGKPFTFQAETVAILPAGKQPELALILDLGDGQPREVPMELKDGRYSVTTVPVPKTEPIVLMSARYGAITISGPVADREFTAGGKAVRLSDVRRLELGPPAQVLKSDGTVLGGEFTRLNGVEVKVGGQVVSLDLTNADTVDLTPFGAPKTLVCTAIAKVGGKEVGRGSVSVTLAGSGPSSSIPGAFGVAKLEADSVTRKLPEAFSEVCCGGEGRYLLFLFPKANKLAVFDVVETRIVHYFPVPESNAKFAAGRDVVIIGLPGQGILQRWSLKTFERELSVTFPLQERIFSVVMGHASEGPVVVNGVFLDARTLKPMDVKGSSVATAKPFVGDGSRVSVSADGTVYGEWLHSASPSGLRVFVLEGNELKSASQHISAGHIVPGPDGRAVYTSTGVYTPELRLIHQQKEPTVAFLPAARGNLFLGMNMFYPPGGKSPDELDISAYVAGDNRPMTKVGRFKGDFEFGRYQSAIGMRNRVWLVPDAQVLITLPATNDVVELTRFDLDKSLEKSGVDYLFIASDPPTAARKGERYSHPLSVKSKRGGVKFKLDSGPPGMTISTAGVILWDVPANFADKRTTAIVSVSDASGQEVFKTFAVTVRD